MLFTTSSVWKQDEIIDPAVIYNHCCSEEYDIEKITLKIENSVYIIAIQCCFVLKETWCKKAARFNFTPKRREQNVALTADYRSYSTYFYSGLTQAKIEKCPGRAISSADEKKVGYMANVLEVK